MNKKRNPYLVKAILSIIFAFVNIIFGILIFYLTENPIGCFISGTSIGLAFYGGLLLAESNKIENYNKFVDSLNSFTEMFHKEFERVIQMEDMKPFKEFESENRKQQEVEKYKE